MKLFFTISHLKRTSRNWSSIYRNSSHIINLISSSSSLENPSFNGATLIRTTKAPLPNSFSLTTPRSMHSLQVSQDQVKNEEEEEQANGPMNEFLSRFVYIMRQKLSEVYPDCDKANINGMLLIIVEKVVKVLEKGGVDQMLDSARENQFSDDEFSQDLWRTVWEASSLIIEDMRKARKREEMKKYLQSEDVKAMVRFAREVGVRGDMLREFRMKWAQEEMEKAEFYENLNRMREEARRDEVIKLGTGEVVASEGGDTPENTDVEQDVKKVVLPQRHGKIKYRVYGLDLSDPKWAEVADRVHEAENLITPEEPKPITGKCKLITERILSLSEENDPSLLLAEWKEHLEPTRIDWLSLLDRLKQNKPGLYLKVTELILSEESFQTNIRDYSKLIEVHAKEKSIEDAERILQKMTEKGIEPDILIYTILVHMYSDAGNLDYAKKAFENLRSRGFQPNLKVYNSMIVAYAKAGDARSGESLLREMEGRDISPTKEIYIELLSAFAQHGQVDGAQRIVNSMQFAGFQPDQESCTLLVEAFGQAGDPDQARNNFDFMIKAGYKPNDRCTASMLTAYGKKNLLDKALNLLLELENNGFEPGISTYTVLVDWLGRLQLVDEVEQILGKIAEKGETPFKVHVSLCDMYSRAGVVKKARETLKIVEGKKELLRQDEFERVIQGLLAGGLVEEAKSVQELMQAQGFTSTEALKVALMAAQTIPRKRPGAR